MNRTIGLCVEVLIYTTLLILTDRCTVTSHKLRKANNTSTAGNHISVPTEIINCKYAHMLTI